MIRFPTPKGIATLVTRATIIAECRLREGKQILTEKQPEIHEAGQPDEGADLTEQILVFAWEPSDMTGVPRRIIEHSLNVNPSLEPFCQKRRTFSPEKSKVVTQRVAERRGVSANKESDNIPSIINTTISEGDNVCISSSGKGGCLSSTADKSKRKTMPSPIRTYKISFLPRNAIKGQVLADFLSDAPDGEAEEEYFRMPEIPPEVDDTEVWTLFTDGAAGLKGSGAGLVLIGPSGLEYTYALRLTFVSTNNEAEYEALLAGYQRVNDQVFGPTKRSSQKSRHSIENIPREDNQKADILSKLATVPFSHLTKEILVEVLNERSTDAKEVQTIVEEEGENWMTSIINYLEEGLVPSNKNEARSLRAKISQYMIESGVLFKKGYLVPMLRCVGPLQTNYVIREIHMGSCGMHIGPRAMVRKAMRQGYYWPTMHADAKEEVDKFVNGAIQKVVANKSRSYRLNPSVAHPQANGLVERANRSLMEGIKTRLGRERSGWVDELPNVLWAHRTSIKQSNGETPFSLTYGSEAERREAAAIREAKYKTKMEQYYNKKVRLVGFRPGEFVYRRNEASRMENEGKLGPNWEGPYRVTKAFENGSYKLQTMETSVPRTWHAVNLRKCYL
ncbi:reverse transcriptase domain-containing protein [Tanacetum coccineum]